MLSTMADTMVSIIQEDHGARHLCCNHRLLDRFDHAVLDPTRLRILNTLAPAKPGRRTA
jgi:hypothetical protein